MSAATSSGFFPCFKRRFASLATVVVLPEPCRPTIMMPAGRSPFCASCSEVSTGPIKASSSSWQILMKWSPGATWNFLPFLSVVVVATTSPSALSFTRARKRLATLTSTSASSRATRMSRSASSMFASVSSALPVSLCLAARKPLVTASSMRVLLERGRVLSYRGDGGARPRALPLAVHLCGPGGRARCGGDGRAHLRGSHAAARRRPGCPWSDRLLAHPRLRLLRRAARGRPHPSLGQADGARRVPAPHRPQAHVAPAAGEAPRALRPARVLDHRGGPAHADAPRAHLLSRRRLPAAAVEVRARRRAVCRRDGAHRRHPRLRVRRAHGRDPREDPPRPVVDRRGGGARAVGLLALAPPPAQAGAARLRTVRSPWPARLDLRQLRFEQLRALRVQLAQPRQHVGDVLAARKHRLGDAEVHPDLRVAGPEPERLAERGCGLVESAEEQLAGAHVGPEVGI